MFILTKILRLLQIKFMKLPRLIMKMNKDVRVFTILEKIIEETKCGMSFSYDNQADLKNYIYNPSVNECAISRAD